MVQVSFNIGAAVKNASINASWTFSMGWDAASSTIKEELTSTAAAAIATPTSSFPVHGSTTPSAASAAVTAAITSSPLEHILSHPLLLPNSMSGHDLAALPPNVGAYIVRFISTALFCCGLGLLAVGSAMIVGAALMGIVYGLLVSVLYVRRWLQIWWQRQRRTEVMVFKEVAGTGQRTMEGAGMTDGAEDTPPSSLLSSLSSS